MTANEDVHESVRWYVTQSHANYKISIKMEETSPCQKPTSAPADISPKDDAGGELVAARSC